LQDTFGTSGTDFVLAQLNRLIALCRDADGKIDNVKLNSMLAMIEGASPANEVQAALAVQMAMTHAAAQTVLQRALRVDQIPQFESASNSAVKLLRTFAMQAETLAKLQRGGEQVVKVVHVHPGGQAIVGNVVSGSAGSSRGGGVSDEKWNQPHATGELPAPVPSGLSEVWCEDERRGERASRRRWRVEAVAECTAGRWGVERQLASGTAAIGLDGIHGRPLPSGGCWQRWLPSLEPMQNQLPDAALQPSAKHTSVLPMCFPAREANERRGERACITL
jgi:hypothetical protein